MILIVNYRSKGYTIYEIEIKTKNGQTARGIVNIVTNTKAELTH